VAEPEGRGSTVTERDSWICSADLSFELRPPATLLTTG